MRLPSSYEYRRPSTDLTYCIVLAGDHRGLISNSLGIMTCAVSLPDLEEGKIICYRNANDATLTVGSAFRIPLDGRPPK